MMRLTILIATLMVVTAVDPALTTKSVQSVNATLEILVSATANLYTPSTLNIHMKLILLWIWAERAVLGRAKTALKFIYKI